MAGDGFYFAANIQDEKKDGDSFQPVVILRIGL